MPRGVAIPEVRQQLFAAVERVINADGPGRLSGRAVTGAAKVATGLLYSHFADFDDFLAGYAVDRSFVIAAQAGALTELAGTGEVAENLATTLTAIPRTAATGVARLSAARPDLDDRVAAVLGPGNTGTDAVAGAVAEYLAAEHRLGRVTTADPEALAEAVAGVYGRLVLAASAQEFADRLRRVLAAVLAGVVAPTPG